MTRIARAAEGKGIFHIIVQEKRGSGVFRSTEIRRLYLKHITEACCRYGAGFYGFCLLPDQAHLIIRCEEFPPGQILRTAHSGFALEYRQQAEETIEGSLFRDRFRSRLLISEDDLLETLRYIHWKPVSEGLCKAPEEFSWSSHGLYFLRTGRIVDTTRVLDALHFSGGYREYMKQPPPDTAHMLREVPARYGRPDEEAEQILNRYLREMCKESFLHLTDEEQRALLTMLRHKEKISIYQLTRITGVSRGIIQRL
ncbi:MAG: transposase [Lachnospiraceae bacterium]|nr:transposase [Lachnospiraceae bacterium]